MIRTKLSTNLGMFSLLPVALFYPAYLRCDSTGKFTQELVEETEVACDTRWGTSTGTLFTLDSFVFPG